MEPNKPSRHCRLTTLISDESTSPGDGELDESFTKLAGSPSSKLGFHVKTNLRFYGVAVNILVERKKNNRNDCGNMLSVNKK